MTSCMYKMLESQNAPLQADLALHERMEQRMMAKVRAAEQALLDGEFHILNSSPLGRAQVERFAALNARIQELEALHGTPAKARSPVSLVMSSQSQDLFILAIIATPLGVHILGTILP